MKVVLYIVVAGAAVAYSAPYVLTDGKHDLEGLRHPLTLLRRVHEKRPGVRGVIRTMLGGISDANVFAFNLQLGAIIVGPALAVGGLVAVIRPSVTAEQRVQGVLMLSCGLLVIYVVGVILLRRGARYLT